MVGQIREFMLLVCLIFIVYTYLLWSIKSAQWTVYNVTLAISQSLWRHTTLIIWIYLHSVVEHVIGLKLAAYIYIYSLHANNIKIKIHQISIANSRGGGADPHRPSRAHTIALHNIYYANVIDNYWGAGTITLSTSRWPITRPLNGTSRNWGCSQLMQLGLTIIYM